MENERIEYLDAIKGVAIFLMVMGHAIGWNLSSWEDVCIYNPQQLGNIKWGGVIWQLIYSFHMPLFFMVSGFLSYKIYRWTDFLPFLKKKSLRLFVPWICTFPIIYFAEGEMGYWFLLCLFEVSVLGFPVIMLLDKINTKKYWLVDLTVIFIVFVVLQKLDVHEWKLYGVEVGRFAKASFPFLLGALLRKHKFLYSLCLECNWFYTIALFLFFLVFSARYFVDEGILFRIMYNHSYVILLTLGSLLVFNLFKQGAFKKQWMVLSYLGKNTLPIYILSVYFVLRLPQIGDYILTQDATNIIVMQIVFAVTISVIAIALSLLLYRIVCGSNFFKRSFFG